MRKLLSGRTVEENVDPTDLTISTKCPAKWLFVDLESGDIWHRNEKGVSYWRPANKKEIQDLGDVLHIY